MSTDTFDKAYRLEGPTSFELYLNEFKNSGPTPTHLIFLIHGIGYKMFEESKFQENMYVLSTTTQDVLFSKYGDSGLRLYYLPITWAAELHALTTVDGRMNKITLPTIPGMRVITNDCLSDVLYYFTDFHRQQLLDIISEKMNVAFAGFKSVYPDFSGNIGILSHSLGGVISYDLLTVKNQEGFSLEDELYSVAFPRTTYPKLDFEPSFLFTLGAPVAAVMVMRGLKYEHFRLSEDTKFLNIFNPYDPLAYRIEPLISDEYTELEPFPIPVCESKESSSYFTSLLPERPNIMRAARTMLANFNLVENIEPSEELESSGQQSDNEFSESSDSEEIQATNQCINELKSVDQDTSSTRRLSSLNATGIGFSTFKRDSVVDRLNRLRNCSSSTFSTSLGKGRPSSFYQAAINSFNSTSSQEKTVVSPKPGGKPGGLKSRRKSFPPPLQSTSSTSQNTATELPKTDHLPFNLTKNSSSGNESDDESSPKIGSTVHSHEVLDVGEKLIPNNSLKLSRSKTWSHLSQVVPPLQDHEEEMMWLWGGVGYGLAKDSEQYSGQCSGPPTSGWGGETPKHSFPPTPLNLNSQSRIEALSIDVSPTLDETVVGTNNEDNNSSRPKLIKKLTSTFRNLMSRDNSEAFTEKTVHQVPMLQHDGSSKTVEIPCSSAANEAALVKDEESKLNIDPDATYPPSVHSSDQKPASLKRYDYCMQTKVMSNLSFEYIVGLGAHFSYWNNRDVSNLVLEALYDLKKKDVEKPNPIKPNTTIRSSHRMSKAFRNSTASPNSESQSSEPPPANSSTTP